MGSEDDDLPSTRDISSTDGESVVLEPPSSHVHSSKSDYKSVTSGGSPRADAHPLASLQDVDPVKETYSMPFLRTSTSKIRDDIYVEPPSYADVTFTPYSADTVAGNGSPSDYGNPWPVSPSSASFSDDLHITVSQPQRVQNTVNSSIIPGSKTYVTYLIATQTNMPQYEGRDFTVRRRFRDVVTLADRLAEAYRGYFIPSRPDKSIVESQVMQRQDFIELRRAAIEKYLNRLAKHPVIRLSDELRLFLQSEGNLPLVSTTDIASRMLDGAANLPRQLFMEGSMVLTPEDVAQPAQGGRDLVRMFKELKQSVTIEWGGAKPAVNEDDKEFLEKKEKLEDLEYYLTEASRHAEVLVTTQQDVGEIIGELGLTFTKVAKFETEEAMLNTQKTHAADARRLATSAVQASRFYREANGQTVRHLDCLHEYLSSMHSINMAFKDRSTALLTVQTLVSEVSSLNTRVEKLKVASSRVFGGDKTRERRVEELKEALMTMEESVNAAKREYEHIKDINKSELERFDRERERDFAEMVKGYVLTQVGYAEKISNVLSKIAEEFKAS